MDAEKTAAVKSGVVSAFLTPGGIGGALGKGGAARTTPTERRMRGAVAAGDVLSLRVHSTSALIPNAILVSPVLRVHLVDSETGFPLNPSGTDTTPVQTAPFDLNRRVKASMSPEWNETLDVEELVPGRDPLQGAVAVRAAPAGPEFWILRREARHVSQRPAREDRVGFPQAPQDQGPAAELWQAPGAAVQVPGEAQGLVGALTKTAFNNWADQKDVVGDLAVYRTWKETIKHAPALRPLYPAHVNVTVAAAPRGGAATFLSSLKDNIKSAAALPAPGMTLKGLVTGKAIKPRPGMKERIERERALGGGWRGAQDVLTSAPADEAAEVTETLGRLPYETLCYGMDADAAAAHQAASTPMKAAIVTAIKQGEDGPGGDVRGWGQAREAGRRQTASRQGTPRRLRDPQRRGPDAGDPSGSRARSASSRRSISSGADSPLCAGGLHVYTVQIF